MTRINAGIHPAMLTDQHLIAEYRETPMVHAALRKALRSGTKEQVLRRVPSTFTLNAGHVRFFYDKLGYLDHRYSSLMGEMRRRGFEPSASRTLAQDLPAEFYGDWSPSPQDNRIVALRILEKFELRHDWYRHYGAPAATLLYTKFKEFYVDGKICQHQDL